MNRNAAAAAFRQHRATFRRVYADVYGVVITDADFTARVADLAPASPAAWAEGAAAVLRDLLASYTVRNTIDPDADFLRERADWASA